MRISGALNTLPKITYRWLKLNYHQLKEETEIPHKPYTHTFSPEKVDSDLIWEERGTTPFSCLKPRVDFGVSQELVALGEKFANTGFYLEIPPGKRLEEPFYVHYELSGENDTVIDDNVLVARKNSVLTLVVEYRQEGEKRAYHHGVTKVWAEEGARVTLIKIQSLGDQAFHFDSNLVEASPFSVVNYRQIELGGKYSVTNYLGQLAENSRADAEAVYLGSGDRVLDLSYKMTHLGYRSKSSILVRGVLQDRSRKVFRGTLDFKRGAKLAVGSEEESVILLDPTVKAEAVPLLLSAEDDVQGEHAVSAGKVDEEQLFYLMSRGFKEQEALKTLVRGSFHPVLKKIPAGVLVGIEEEIGRRLVFGER